MSRVKKMLAGFGLALLTAGILAWSQTQNYSGPTIPSAVHSKELLKDVAVPWSATKNTVRLNTSNPVRAAILTSKTLWPSDNAHSRPDCVILVDSRSWAIAAASTDLLQHTLGPLLYVEEEGIPRETLEELRRLKPKGSQNNKGIDIITVGPISDAVKKDLSGLDYKVDAITAEDPARAAAAIDEYSIAVTGTVSSSVIIGSLDRAEYTLPAISWISHNPEALLYVSAHEIPTATVEALEKRQGRANIYILGPEKVVSADVEKMLRPYGNVKRISAEDPYDNAIQFAQYHDADTDFGWGMQSAGYSFSFSTPDAPALSIAAAPLSHMGQHAPLLFTERDGVPRALTKYVDAIQQQHLHSKTDAPVSHAWIIGDEQTITSRIQTELDRMLDTISTNK
ncbi:hypothetical protein JCM10914A_42580 [Paenibacillus sp. JCM 10914]|uniref:cell wall-binding repeat-containing protein n=1 Tax=Paenibacillus sp. JCM 10914 TaxID=1236974 RepID=UPI0003CC5B73|nr:cell wall-binding repeat-containing protein [Paenibacillus sp. JCM 10914]GAE05475.1 lipoprotein, putative [Paenibacillus sp. JCM 10914]